MPRTLLSLFVLFGAAHANAADPLHARIDTLIEAKAKADGVALSAPADDAEFVRRAYLDFAGRIPTADEASAFLKSTAPDKRARLIDTLLAAPEYAPRMADLFHVMLMERLGDSPEWTKFLRSSFERNDKWDAMVRKMLRADPRDTAAPGAAFWLAKRLENYGQNPVDYSGLTRDVGRLFLGKNFQCCECHDHLTVDDYKQQHFQGLHTFFKNTYLANAAKLTVGEKPTTEKTGFASVFTKVPMATAPSLPGAGMIEIPPQPKGMEFAEQPDKKTGAPGALKFSPLKEISERLPTKANPDFARNSVNRLWFLLLGRGIVHPLDLHHSGNPPSHPELLALLADDFAQDFDIKRLLREIALTKTYARSSKRPAGAKEAPHAKYFATALERRLTAEQLLQSVLMATGGDPKAADALRPKYVKAFANQPREPEDEVTPSLKGALFVLHDDAVLGLLKPKAGNLVARAAALSDADATDALYLAVLSRSPGADEKAAVQKVLARHAGDKRADAVGRIAWALLASMEFGVNH